MFSILHVSDLHRAKSYPISNHALLAALKADRQQYTSLPYDALEFVGDLTNEVYFGANRYGAVLDPYTYAKKWVLRDKASRSTYSAMGKTWAARQGKKEMIVPLKMSG
jgi:hypothetical protein